jgi:hypothetical protein
MRLMMPIRKLFGRLLGQLSPGSAGDLDPRLRTVLDVDLSWLQPPRTLDDPASWDTFWHDQLERGIAGFTDMFCHDGSLIDAMRHAGFGSVLCVGNGLSQEARALSVAGFDVTALDLSPFAMATCERMRPPEDYIDRFLEGRERRPGGRVRFVSGDLRDGSLCPGPYDVVIERKTLQLFPPAERLSALKAVTARLADPGILYSHAHNGAWRPGESCEHPLRALMEQEGLPECQAGVPPAGRERWLFLSTG